MDEEQTRSIPAVMFNLLQLAGGIILSLGYIPQIRQIVTTRSVRDLNLGTFSLVALGVLFMELYALWLVRSRRAGVMFLITNTMALGMAMTVVVLILAYS